MNDLSNQECVVCRADSPRIFVADSQEYMDVLKDWSINQMDSIDKLHRRYTLSNFSVALEFTNKIGDLAEAEDHHPVLVTEWGAVEVYWWTHVIHGLHRNDFVMAARCDKIFCQSNE